jgi:c-di-GMP-binding flagellar brake protein YcgR
MTNSRKYARFPMSGLVAVKVIETQSQFSGMIELISLGGVGIYTKEKLEARTRVELQIISFSGASSLNYTLTGIVRNHDRHNEFGVVGIEFDQPVSSSDQPHLYDFLRGQERKLSQYLATQ